MADDFVQRGKGLLVRREFAEVVEVCRRGLAENPKALDGRLLLGTALLALRRYDEVLEEMRVAEAQDKASVLVHLLRGEALLKRGDTLAAIEALAEAHAIDPQNKVAAKLYNEALERAHGSDAEGESPEAIAAEISGRIAVPVPLGVPVDEAADAARATARGTGRDLGALIAEETGGPRVGAAAIVRGAAEPPGDGARARPVDGPHAGPAGGGGVAAAAAGGPAPGSAAAGAREAAGAAGARPRRRRWPWIVAAAVLVVVGGGAGAAYLAVRASRQAEELRTARGEAERAAAAQTFRGYRRALDLYRRLADDGDAAAGAQAGRLAAAIAFEFGSRGAGAARQGSATDPTPSAGRDDQKAAVYTLLASGDAAAAARAAQLLVAAYPDDAEAAYLAGRAGLAAGDPGARASLKRSIALAPSPLAWTALGVAEAGDGHVDDALRAFDAALALVPGHPAALVARARALAASGRLPEGEEPERGLARLADSAVGSEPDPVASPAQAHLASLALAEVRLARGDAAAARKILETVAPTELGDPRFGEALVVAELAVGDVGAAEQEAEKWRRALPASGAPHVWLARVALARDRADAARAELEQAGEARESASGLIVQGEVELAAGRLDAATAALDRAVALRPADRDAQVLRARADLARGDAAAAEARLTPLYEAARDPVIGIALGECLLARDAGPQARVLLEESVAKLEASGVRPRLLAGASLALARLARAEGRWAEAQRAVARTLAIDARDVDARLLDAQLRADAGDALGARAALDTLAVAAHADPRVLVAAARAHAMTADATGARPLLEEAVRLGGAPKGEIAEATARLLLLEGRPDDAAAALLAGSGPETAGATLVLIDALVAAGKIDDAAAAAGDVARRYAGRAEENLANGRVQLARKDAPGALASFATALQRLEAGAASAQALSDARAWLGRAQELAGKPDEALASFREAVRLSPTGGTATVLLGRALVAKGDFAAAEKVLAQAVKLDPSLADAYFWLAHAQRGQRKQKDARQALQTYLELAPHGAQAGAAQKMLAE